MTSEKSMINATNKEKPVENMHGWSPKQNPKFITRFKNQSKEIHSGYSSPG